MTSRLQMLLVENEAAISEPTLVAVRSQSEPRRRPSKAESLFPLSFSNTQEKISLETSKAMRSSSHTKADSKLKRRSTNDLCYTVADFNREFPDDDACLEYIKEQRWPNGLSRCEKCHMERKHYRVNGRTAYACDHCGNHIYPLAGTVFAKSTTSLKTWFYVMYLMASTAGRISAKRIQRETGVTYKTAWRTLRQLGLLIANEQPQSGHALSEIEDPKVCALRRNQDAEDSLPGESASVASAAG